MKAKLMSAQAFAQEPDETCPIAGNSSLTTGSGYAEIACSRPREWFATLQYEF